MERLGITEESDSAKHQLVKRTIQSFTSKLQEKWKECCRISERFESRNSEWLNSSLDLAFEEIETPSKTFDFKRPSLQKGF